MEIDYNMIGARIKKTRMRKGISLVDLAELINVTKSYVSHIEKGRRSMSLEIFVAIAKALNVSADELLSDVLGNKIRSTSHEMLTLLSDCSEFEGRVLLGCMRGAKEEMRLAIAKMQREIEGEEESENNA